MGEVYKARDTRTDRSVALKVSAAQFSERFEILAERVYNDPVRKLWAKSRQAEANDESEN